MSTIHRRSSSVGLALARLLAFAACDTGSDASKAGEGLQTGKEMLNVDFG